MSAGSLTGRESACWSDPAWRGRDGCYKKHLPRLFTTMPELRRAIAEVAAHRKQNPVNHGGFRARSMDG